MQHSMHEAICNYKTAGAQRIIVPVYTLYGMLWSR